MLHNYNIFKPGLEMRWTFSKFVYFLSLKHSLLNRTQSRMSISNHNILQDISSCLRHQNTSSEAHIPDAREEDIPVCLVYNMTLD